LATADCSFRWRNAAGCDRRALVREPAVYLMDEPLSSLDAKLRAELRLELKRIQRELERPSSMSRTIRPKP